jgi:hypothetical protein
MYCEGRCYTVRGDVVLRGDIFYIEGRYCSVKGDVV